MQQHERDVAQNAGRCGEPVGLCRKRFDAGPLSRSGAALIPGGAEADAAEAAGDAGRVASIAGDAVEASSGKAADAASGTKAVDATPRASGAADAIPAWVPKSISEKIPDDWGPGQATRKGDGWRRQDPANPGNGFRIDRGNVDNDQPLQQVDHVLLRSNGQVLRRDGAPIFGTIKSNPEASHIPASEYSRWSACNKR